MDDLLVRGGLVLDGSGAPGRPADVAVREGRIVAVEADHAGPARRVIDARGLAVAPGFIDIHCHSDFSLPVNPRAESAIRQGVTTQVVGNCGFSVAPVLPGHERRLADYLASSGPWLEVRETTFAKYLDTFPSTAINTVMQVGHHTLRMMVVGMDDRAPTADEQALMERLLDEALAAGALGLSSGLFTAPGSYAAPSEMIALGRVLQRHGGGYAAHVRDEANRVFEAVREAIAVGETCGIHVQIGHLKLSGIDNWGGAAALLGEIEAARLRGVRVDCDQYPYTAGSNPLRNLLPVWVQDGGIDALLRRLADPAVRVRLRAEIEAGGLQNFGRISSWEAVRVALSPHRPQTAGLTIAELARRGGGDGLDAACEQIIGDRGATRIVVTSMDERDVQAILRAPDTLVGSDGMAVAPEGPTGLGKPHPRVYGTFPRVLGHYARDLGLLPLPLAVAKMTGGSARALGLRERGLLRPGHCADITVFDPATIAERATYDDPHRYPAGIPTVIVNGAVVVDGGEHTGVLPGRVLRRAG